MFRIVRTIISVVLAIIEFLLSLRLLLIFFGANPRAPFVTWIYDTSAPLIAPFTNIFHNFRIGGFVIDLTTLVALIVFSLVGHLIVELFSFV